VGYYNNTTFSGTPVKTSITPAVDFDLNTYQGTNSPDASAGVVSTGYGISWTGFIQNVPSGQHGLRAHVDSVQFFLTSDDVAQFWIGSTEVINKPTPGLSTATGSYKLAPNQTVPITIRYTHSSTNPASMHIYWLNRSEPENIIQIVPAPGS
jgi:hypothetical protein